MFGTIVLALALPAIVISSAVNSLIFDPTYYATRQTIYSIGQSTEYSQEQLRPVNNGLVQFFENPGLTLPAALANSGANPAVFNAREIGHMNDVRAIIRGLVRIQWIASIAVLITLVAFFYVERNRGVHRFAGGLAAGSVVTLLLITAIGLLSLTDFERVFLTFHQMSFDNDLWLLDPRTDNLIRFFPFEFWFDATVTVAQRSVFAAVGTLIAAVLGRRLLGQESGSQ